MDFQLIIIGSGPGGYVAAVRAAKLGIKTAVVEKAPHLGGTCLNVGCIPSKALLASSEHFHYASHRFASHGIKTSGLEIDVPAMMKRKDGVVDSLRKGIEYLFKSNQITRLVGTGSFVDAHTVAVTDAEGKATTHTADNILIATGSVPASLPGIDIDGQQIITSDQALALDHVPGSILVIGAGAIGLELGSVWSRLGAKVDIIEFLPRIAAGFDMELSKSLQKMFEKQGLTFHLNTKVQVARRTEGKVTLTALQDGKEKHFEAETLLVAVGRKPFTEGLNLSAAGISTDERGRIPVDEQWRTSAPHIRAVGDVTAGPMLAHKAEAEGTAAVERIAGQAGSVNADLIPNVIYTSPEAASVGLTEEQLKESDIPYRTGKHSFLANGRARAVDQTDGFVKLLTHAETDRLLGAHIISSNASELIAECVAVMAFSGSSEDLARTIHAHPTMAETIKEAAQHLL
ncbi:MAG: dihydrolipoyl dehydrogenase [Candidatus Methylacidiphilales bacterium]